MIPINTSKQLENSLQADSVLALEINQRQDMEKKT